MDNARFVVVKETTAFVQCPDCTGGYNVKQFQGVKMKTPCSSCKGSMRKKITHRTEVPLQEAIRAVSHEFLNGI